MTVLSQVDRALPVLDVGAHLNCGAKSACSRCSLDFRDQIVEVSGLFLELLLARRVVLDTYGLWRWSRWQDPLDHPVGPAMETSHRHGYG